MKELEEALLEGRIDVAVHSAKDMTSTNAAGLSVGAYLARDDPRDALCGAEVLRAGMRVGTASVRRRAQLLTMEPELHVEPLRGNIDTRLRKAEAEPYDAIVLAAVGLQRMGWEARIAHYLSPAECLPMVGQGARAVEARAGDAATIALVQPLDDRPTRLATSAERAFLRRLGAGCRAAIAAHATLDGDRLTIDGLIGEPRGAALYRTSVTGEATTVAMAEGLGDELAARLLDRGGDRLVAEAAAAGMVG